VKIALIWADVTFGMSASASLPTGRFCCVCRALRSVFETGMPKIRPNG